MIINFNWVLFSHTSWKMGLNYCKGMLGGYGNPVMDISFFHNLREYGIYLVLAILFSTPVAPWLSGKIQERDKMGIMAIIVPVGLVFALAWAISFIMLGAHNPFLYQQF